MITQLQLKGEGSNIPLIRVKVASSADIQKRSGILFLHTLGDNTSDCNNLTGETLYLMLHRATVNENLIGKSKYTPTSFS